MVDDDFCINPEFFREHVFISQTASCQFTYCMDAVLCQTFSDTGAGLSEVGKGLVIPEQVMEGLFVQFSNSDTIRIWLCVLGNDVHCKFA